MGREPAPGKAKQAAALVRDGITVSLASDAETVKSEDVPCPMEWAMVTATQSAATDRIAYPCIHGAGTTHLDSFAHVFFGGKMWNGYAVDGVVTKDRGAARNSILTMKSGIVTRGCSHIARLKGGRSRARYSISRGPEAWNASPASKHGRDGCSQGADGPRRALGRWPVNGRMAGRTTR